MRVAKWENSLAVRLPAAVVGALTLRRRRDRNPCRRQQAVRDCAQAGARPTVEASSRFPGPSSSRLQIRSGRRQRPLVSSTPDVLILASGDAARQITLRRLLRKATRCASGLASLPNVARRSPALHRLPIATVTRSDTAEIIPTPPPAILSASIIRFAGATFERCRPGRHSCRRLQAVHLNST
jgi:hypothetical protein